MNKHLQKRHQPNVWARLLAFVGAFVICLATLFPMDALARRDNPMVRSYDATKWGSLTLHLTYTKDESQTATPLDGATLRLVRIADLSMGADGPHYTLRSGLTSLHYDFTKMTSSDLRRAGQDIATYIQSHPKALTALGHESNTNVKPKLETAYKAVRTATTNAQGKVSFDHLVHGVYLVTQEGKAGAASQFAPMSPVLYFVPEYLKAGSSAAWVYDIVANPKYSPNQPPTPPESSSTPKESSSTPTGSSTTPPESSSTPPENPPTSSTPTPPTPPVHPKTPTPGTGDKIRLGLWIGTGLLAFIALLMLLRKKRNKEDNDVNKD
ncbi:hypothetical protein [Levyella massiliensis]|uniref:hypothetical protein n=1 Tax=Levyella massiliensis TaxID=938289 RepID=UPI00036D97A7|nr:hypothetical protein [Levyella massiliensis]